MQSSSKLEFTIRNKLFYASYADIPLNNVLFHFKYVTAATTLKLSCNNNSRSPRSNSKDDFPLTGCHIRIHLRLFLIRQLDMPPIMFLMALGTWRVDFIKPSHSLISFRFFLPNYIIMNSNFQLAVSADNVFESNFRSDVPA